MIWLNRHLYAKQDSNLKQSTKGDERIILEILRRSGNFSFSLYICVRKLCLPQEKKSQLRIFSLTYTFFEILATFLILLNFKDPQESFLLFVCHPVKKENICFLI